MERATGVQSVDSSDLKDSRWNTAQLYLWLAVAGISLGWGVFSALKPGHSQDLKIINTWLRTWLWEGSSPYYLPAIIVGNYPPHGIVVLSPVALIPESWVASIWALMNLAMAPLVGYLAYRAMKPGAAWRAALLPCAMFLAWAGLRTGIGNGQFTLLILGLGLLAFIFEEKRPVLGGIFLALALAKPHIGGAFLLWALFTKRWKMTLVACVLMGLGVGIFSLRLGESPFTSVRAYLAVIQQQFGRGAVVDAPNPLRAVELRPLISLFISNDVWANRIHQVLLLALLGCIWLAAVIKSGLSRQQRDVVVLLLCCLWVLMSVFHNPYDSILLVPVLMALWVASVPHPFAPQRRHEQPLLWVLQMAMVIELPGVWWRLSQGRDLAAFNWAGAIMFHFDRLLVLSLFVYVLHRVRLYRLADRETRGAGEMLSQPSTQNT